MPVDRSSARKALKSIERVVERIRSEHLSVLLFPEGTRSSTGELNVFKQGSMALPLKARVPLVPVYLQGTHHINRKNSRLIHPGNVKVMIGEPIALDGPTDLDKREILLRVREAIEAMKARADC
jgi:1-acyl-sn-glycerol-3-phosphate acyltransferase